MIFFHATRIGAIYMKPSRMVKFIFKAIIFIMVFTIYFFEKGFCADFGENLRSDYGYIDMIGQELKNNSSQIDVESEIQRVRNAIVKLTYGDFYNSKTVAHYSRLITEQSIKYGIDPLLIVAVISMESSFRQWVVSDVGAIGLMQLRLPTARYIAKKMGLSAIKNWRELFNSRTNISLGVAYIAHLTNLTGSLENALIAYNIGPSVLYTDIKNNETIPMEYVYGVMSRYDEIKSLDIDPLF